MRPVVLFGYSVGSLIDRIKPIRVVPATFFLWSALGVISFFVVRDKYSAAVMGSLISINFFAQVDASWKSVLESCIIK